MINKLRRLFRLPLHTIPFVVARRLTGLARSQAERFLYTPYGRRFPNFSPPVDIQPLRIFTDTARGTFATSFRVAYPEDAGRIVAQADQATEQIVDVLGSGPVDLKKFKHPWHTDVKSGAAWDPHLFFADIRYGQTHGVDVKVPWEISRCQHFVTLAQAYALTQNEKYSRAYAAQLQNWVISNPPKRGVNWACPMDVALRAGNWLAAWDVFSDALSGNEMVVKTLAASLHEHGAHIYHHLEWGGGISGNHYLSDLLGLAYIGLAIGNARWVSFAKKEFGAEMERQVYRDGLDYEGSTAYHRLVLELFIYFSLALVRSRRRNEAPVDTLKHEMGEAFVNRLRAMFKILQKLTNNEGRVPLIGDNDSGRVHVFRQRGDEDMGYLLNIGAAFFNDPSLKVAEWERTSETAWLFGLDGNTRQENMGGIAAKDIPPVVAGGSNLVTMRGAQDFALFNAMPNGTRGIGNHQHNDKLSVILSAGGDDFLIDAGTYLYTPDPEARNRFRSTAVHNTVMVDGQEQNRFIDDALFLLRDDAHVTIHGSRENEWISASHNGYARLAEPVIHRRSFERSAAPLSWRIEDQFEGKGRHRLQWSFLLGDSIRPVLAAPARAVLTGEHGELTIVAESNDVQFQLRPAEVSPAYGRVLDTQLLFMDVSAELPFQLRFTLSWRPL